MRQNRIMRLMRLVAMGLILCLGAGLAGCCGPSAIQADYGRSVTNNLAQQVVNPQAGLETAPAAGLTPSASTNLYGKYEQGFKAEEGKGLGQFITTGGK
jgi:hypothetical protein